MFRKVRRFCRGLNQSTPAASFPRRRESRMWNLGNFSPTDSHADRPGFPPAREWRIMGIWENERDKAVWKAVLTSLKLCFQTALKRGKPPIGNLRHIAMFDRIEMQIIKMAGKIGLIADFIVLCSEWFCRSDFRIRRFGALRQWIAIAGMLEVLSDTIIRPTVAEIFCILRGENIDLCFQY